jgi:hypothetical protein
MQYCVCLRVTMLFLCAQKSVKREWHDGACLQPQVHMRRRRKDRYLRTAWENVSKTVSPQTN